ncbi:MAG TPA: ABC-2 family transporter protein [Candidatus Saccharimonadales bacterium]|nr:ABC-2 family transporter protein [Candidatus Saccharimonadales bacterium]
MKTLIRYLKVYRTILRLNLVQLFTYRVNLINSIIGHTVWAAFIIISMLLLTSRTSSVFGWTRNELLILAGTYNIILSIFYFLFSRNFNEFSNTIHYGKLDALITKPIDIQFLMTCMYVSYTHVIRFILGVGFVIFILNQMHMVFTIVTFLWFILFLVLSIVILYSIWLLVMTITIWHTKLSNLADLLYEGHSVSKYPQEIFKGASWPVYFILFPLTLIVTIPTKVLLQKMLLGDIFWPIIFAIGLFGISRRFWKFALRYYTSASG